MAKESTVDEELLAKLGKISLFKDLAEETRQNKKQRQALSDFHRFQFCDYETVFVQQGEYTGEFCVVLEGIVAAYRVEPNGETRKLGTLEAGQWFGEMSAMSNQPAMASVRAESECVLLLIDPPLFKELYEGSKGKNDFKKNIDETYRERALAIHLRVAPLLTDLGERALTRIQERAELVVFEEGEVLARQDEDAEAVYLIRSGSVKCVYKDPVSGAERILSYYKGNSSFGERTLAKIAQRWPGTFTAMARTDAVRLSREVFEQAFGSDTATFDKIRATADQIVAEEKGVATGIFEFAQEAKPSELDTMVKNESAKGGRALVIDLSKCTRCNACVESCVAVHEDGVPRLSKKGNRISQGLVLSSACYSCAIPDCMQACDYGAIRRDARGQIHFVFDNCTGCTFCVPACPYDVIRMTPPPGTTAHKAPGLFESLPLLGRFFKKKEEEPEEEPEPPKKLLAARTGKQVAGKAIKCDLCAGLPYEACVYNCPCGAIDRFDPSALFGD